MKVLSEQAIKQAALSYFKTYYKFRPRVSTEQVAQYDMVTETGAIADGYLSFQETDEKRFLATFEATAVGTKHEVEFKILKLRLFWDGAAFSAVLSLIAFAFAYIYKYIDLYQTGIFSSVLLYILPPFIFFYLAFLLICRQLPKYRKIYAIEQFKQYHADEQWVAIGTDVFEDKAHRQYEELKKQCIYNGFGLLEIDEALQARKVIAPSKNLVLTKRKEQNFANQAQVTAERLNKNMQGKFKGFFKNLSNRLPWYRQSRFQGNYYWKHVFVMLSALALIGTIFYQDYLHHRPIDEIEHHEIITQNDIGNIEPEPKLYMIDTSYAPPIKEGDIRFKNKLKIPPKPTFTERKMEEWKERAKKDTSEYTLPKEEVPDRFLPKKKRAETKEEATSNKNLVFKADTLLEKGPETIEMDWSIPPECLAFKNWKEGRFVIQENVFSTVELALARVKQLRANGLDVHLASLMCFEGLAPFYAVIFRDAYLTKARADGQAKHYQRYLKNKRLETGKVLVRQVRIRAF